MKVISFTNRKGGVGKSTMSTHIAAGLAIQGLRVALVDTDSQGHSALMLGQHEQDGLYKLLIEKAPIADVLREIPHEVYSPADHPAKGNLYLLPSSEMTYQIPVRLREHETFLFYETLEAMGQAYALDVVIVDTNPTLSLFDGSIYLATDGFIFVTECEQLSFDGIQSAIEHVKNFAHMRKHYMNRLSQIVGIIPNKFRKKTTVHQHNVTQLTAAYGDLVWPKVALRTIWTEVTNAHELIYTYAPTGVEAREMWDKVERTRKVLEVWATEKTR